MAKPKEKPGVLMYWEMFDTLEGMRDERVKVFLRAIRDFAQYGEVPDFQEDEVLESLWPMTRQKLITDGMRYEEIRLKNRIKGICSDFKRNYAPANGIDPDDRKALEEYIKQKLAEDENNNQEQSTVVDCCRPIQPTTASTASTTSTTSTTTNIYECVISGYDTPHDTSANREPAQKKPKKPAKHKYGEYNNVLLTDDELDKLKAKFPDWAKRIEDLSHGIASKGYKYTSHYATILNWARRDEEKEKAKGKKQEYQVVPEGYDDPLDGLF